LRLGRRDLEALRGGALPFEELFARAHHRREDPVFLADAVLAWHLERLRLDGFLVKNGEWGIAPKGEEVLAGKNDAWAEARSARWLGGYEVRDGRLRWDPDLARLVRV
jgi:hypothetical protein